MRRSKKLDRIHSLLVLLFSIICITGAVLFCYDKSIVAYICWCACILMIFPCAGIVNFEYRSSLWEEFFNEIKNKEQKEQSYETTRSK